MTIFKGIDFSKLEYDADASPSNEEMEHLFPQVFKRTTPLAEPRIVMVSTPH